MVKLELLPPFQTQVSFHITERCNLRCKHCLVSAEGTGMDMDLADLRRWLDEATAVDRIERVCMTGGEPFLIYDVLQEAVAYATSLGLQTAVVTNGYWASDMAQALHKLEGLAPLSSLTVSFDRFHQQFIPVETVKTAILAALEIGIDTRVRTCYVTDEKSEVAEAKRLLGDVLEDVRFETQATHPYGRAASELGQEQFYSFTCDDLCVNASRHLVLPDGQVYACCGPSVALEHDNPLWLGNVKERSLSSVLEEAQYNVPLHIIRTKGPYYLWSLVCQNGDLQRYDTTNLCTLCISLMSDPEFLRDLETMVQDARLRKQVALERFFLLQEPAMLTGQQES